MSHLSPSSVNQKLIREGQVGLNSGSVEQGIASPTLFDQVQLIAQHKQGF